MLKDKAHLKNACAFFVPLSSFVWVVLQKKLTTLLVFYQMSYVFYFICNTKHATFERSLVMLNWLIQAFISMVSLANILNSICSVSSFIGSDQAISNNQLWLFRGKTCISVQILFLRHEFAKHFSYFGQFSSFVYFH